MAAKKMTGRDVLQDVLGCKWTIEVLRAVEGGEHRPGQIQRRVHGITAKVMNERLRKLVRFDILSRHAFPEVPPRVEYRLTARGRQLRVLLRQFDRLSAAWESVPSTRSRK